MIEEYKTWKAHSVDEYAELLRKEMKANGLHPERHEQAIMDCAAIMRRIRDEEDCIYNDGYLVTVPTVHGETKTKNPALMMLNYDEQRFAALASRLGILVNMGGRPDSDRTKMEDEGDKDKLFGFISHVKGAK